MKIIFAFIAIIAMTAVGLSGCIRDTRTGTVFTDSTGVQWRVLAIDEQGNQLIITERVHGLTTQYSAIGAQYIGTQYNSANVYTSLGQSDVLRPVLDAWFANTLAPELREVAIPVENAEHDVRLTPEEDDMQAFYLTAAQENDSAGWTRAGTGTATAENALFILSISEVNKYKSLGTLDIKGVAYLVDYEEANVAATWWLRSPGTNDRPVAVVWTDTEAGVHVAPATSEEIGFRPALWVSR